MAETFKLALKLILEYWWIITPVALFFILRNLWLSYLQTKYLNSLKWVFLEIKIPKEVPKTPKAMEQTFAGLHAAQDFITFTDKWFKGEVPGWFSLEIIGQGGKVKFFIRTVEKFRNLVEAQIYAQYPGAEISEAEDYSLAIPAKIPSEDYDLWGTELILSKEDAYPIRTFPYFFEEAKEEERIDPIASLAEGLSSLSPDEYIWVQILISPVGDKWKEKGDKLVEKLIGKKVERTKGGLILEEAHSWFQALLSGLGDLFFASSEEFSVKKSVKKEERKVENLILYLTPGQREVVSEVEKNISKLGFRTLIRFIYWAKSDVFSSANRALVIGAFKQFNTQNLNGFTVNLKTIPPKSGLFVKRRKFNKKLRLLNNYRKRHFLHNLPKRGFILNTEELATIYHIPGKIVEAPTMPRIEAKKGGPPASLPIE